MSLNSSQVVLGDTQPASALQLPSAIILDFNTGVLGKYRPSLIWLREPERARSFSYLCPQLRGCVEVFKSCNSSPDNPRWAERGCVWETWQALKDERLSDDPRGSPTLWHHISSHKQPDLEAHPPKTLEECICAGSKAHGRPLCLRTLRCTHCTLRATTLDTDTNGVLSDPCREVLFSHLEPRSLFTSVTTHFHAYEHFSGQFIQLELDLGHSAA